jgi:hypothetical protein
VLGRVVQDTVGGGPVTLGAGYACFVLGVREVEQRQALLVGLLRVGGRVVDAADAGGEQVDRRELAHGVVVAGARVDQVRDPMLDMRVVRLVDLDLVLVVVGRDDRGEPGALDSLGQAAEPGEEIAGDVLVVPEAASTCSRTMLGGHRPSPSRAPAPAFAVHGEAWRGSVLPHSLHAHPFRMRVQARHGLRCRAR